MRGFAVFAIAWPEGNAEVARRRLRKSIALATPVVFALVSLKW
jgi:hypothetical protein